LSTCRKLNEWTKEMDQDLVVQKFACVNWDSECWTVLNVNVNGFKCCNLDQLKGRDSFVNSKPQAKQNQMKRMRRM